MIALLARVPVKFWVAIAILLFAGFQLGDWVQSRDTRKALADAAQARAEAIQSQALAQTCSAGVKQLGEQTREARARLTAAEAAVSAQEPARAARTVIITRSIQEAPSCSIALRIAWQSAPQ